MGAMAELRPIIVIGSLIAIIVILISIMPAEFFGSNGTTVTPENTNFSSILGTNDTIEFNFTGHTYDFGNKDFGGWHIDVQEVSTYGAPALWVQITDAWYGYFYNRNDFKWYDINNVEVDKSRPDIPDPTYPGYHNVMLISDINNEYLAGNITNLLYYLECSKTMIKATFYFDISIYSNVISAYAAGKLTMVIGINFNERNSQINAWSVIGSFLTFQLIPNCEPTIALIVEIPFWFAELYVVFIMVLRVIGAVFGGGGA